MNKFFQMAKSLGGTFDLFGILVKLTLLHQVKHGWLLSGQGEPLYGLPSDPCLFQCGRDVSNPPPRKEGRPMVYGLGGRSWYMSCCGRGIEMPFVEDMVAHCHRV